MMRVLEHRLGLVRPRLRSPCSSRQHVVGRDHVRIELDLKGGVGRADLGHALDAGSACTALVSDRLLKKASSDISSSISTKMCSSPPKE